jgi:hypothetical protein
MPVVIGKLFRLSVIFLTLISSSQQMLVYILLKKLQNILKDSGTYIAASLCDLK